ncbi:MAG: MBL fold metallo-hydrolase [Actinobacteria bacterium]|nr:MBL fold metallo-hydrolase [Actinomycetota bacterium]MBU4490272.1 MBL fold metallo-hydrolase [Actinomycetota bacterium]
MVNDGVVDIGGLKVLAVPGRGFPQNVPCDAYLLESAGEILLVDTGADREVGWILDAAGPLGASISLMVNTHAHFDQLAGNAKLLSAGVAALLAPGGAEKLVERYGEASRSYRGQIDLDELSAFFTNAEVSVFMNYYNGQHMTMPEVPVSRSLAGGDTVRFGDVALEVIEAPGHSPHHLCLLDRERGALFSGSALLSEGIAYAGDNLFEPGGEGDVAMLLESTSRLEGLPFDALFSSAGFILEGGPGRARETALYYREFEERLLELLSGGPSSPEELARSLHTGERTRMQAYRDRAAVLGMLRKLQAEGVGVPTSQPAPPNPPSPTREKARFKTPFLHRPT